MAGTVLPANSVRGETIVKNQIVWAVGALALAASVYVGGTLWAQQAGAPVATTPPSAAPQPHTRIAFVNLAYVLKNYVKVNALTDDMKKNFTEFEAKAKGKKAQMEQLDTENQNPQTAQAKREANMESMKQLKRDIEDINAQAKKILGDKSDANTVTLYREIQDAASRYAMANNFEMVLQFSDAFTETDYNSPMNIMSKMQTRACLPMFYQGGNDISMQVVTNLNDGYRKINPAAFTVPAGAAPKGN
jgi:Skp family chaperone for outer membrane proteins